MIPLPCVIDSKFLFFLYVLSGMWGIFYYKEITNKHSIRYWFLSATLSIVGIIWLSRERILAKQHTTEH